MYCNQNHLFASLAISWAVFGALACGDDSDTGVDSSPGPGSDAPPVQADAAPTDAAATDARPDLPPALLRINELSANKSNSCDLIELRVISGGTIEGIKVFERDQEVVEFSWVSVIRNDIIMVHFNGLTDTGTNETCNRGGSGNETLAPNQYINNPPSEIRYPDNFDTAYDWYSRDEDFIRTTNVITVVNAMGAITDAVFLTNDAQGPTANNNTEARAAIVAAAGHWQRVGGGNPAGGYVDADFNAHAVPDLDSPSGSIQRIDDLDDNDRDDWSVPTPNNPTSSWGVLNAGQSPF